MTTSPFDTATAAQTERLSPRVDLACAAVIFAFAIAAMYFAWLMPTFLERKGEIYVAPGLVPGFYGIVIALLSLVLGARALFRARRSLGSNVARPAGGGAQLAIVAALGLAFCFVLIGRMPFWLATAIFVSAFIAVFEWQAGDGLRRCAWRLSTAALQGLGTGVAVTLVFQKLFLVRLP
jgi:putative tricarboxylic transport membrane protein